MNNDLFYFLLLFFLCLAYVLYIMNCGVDNEPTELTSEEAVIEDQSPKRTSKKKAKASKKKPSKKKKKG